MAYMNGADATVSRFVAWAFIALTFPIAALILGYHHHVGYGYFADILTIIFLAVVMMGALPIWGGWRSFGSWSAGSRVFADFIMEPVFLRFNSLHDPNSVSLMDRLGIMVRAALAAFPAIVCLVWLQRIEVQQGWAMLQSEFTVNNVIVIENPSSLILAKSPQDFRKFVADIHHIKPIASHTGMFTPPSSQFVRVVCKDGFQAALFDVDHRGTFVLANEAASVARATTYMFHSDALYRWYRRTSAAVANE